MKATLKLLLILYICVSSGITLAQEGIWYKADVDFNERLIFSKDSISAERYKTYGVDTPYWESNRALKISKTLIEDNSSYMVFDLPEGDKAGGVFTMIDNKYLIVHTPNEKYGTIDILKELPGQQIPHRVYLSEQEVKNIDSYKGIAELTKEDLVSAIKFVQSYDADFEKMLEKNPGLKSFSLSRMAQNLYHLKLYQLGYNPYDLPVEGNYLEQFEGDEDLKTLFENNTYFQLRF
ncbi:hypothetical protein [uncultured Psychroserpens sp.]|uniref:hypothetical protein n=1 Tax=uncultured Psychroserpens sp. TaxID=255436 RepID=UPI002615329B|nr:hypothetical protein [uncultured Psychroserpens sp.]